MTRLISSVDLCSWQGQDYSNYVQILFVVHDIAPYKLCVVVRRRCRLFGHCRTRARTDSCIEAAFEKLCFYYKKI